MARRRRKAYRQREFLQSDHSNMQQDNSVIARGKSPEKASWKRAPWSKESCL